MIHAGSGAKSSCCGSLQDSLFFCTATLPYVLVSACWTCGGLNTRRLPPSQRNPAGPRIRREGARLPSDARVRTKTKGRGPPAACKVCNGMDASFFFAHLLVARAIGGFPLHPAEARTPERGRRRKAGPRPRNVPRAHPECNPPPPLQSALVALGCALLLEARRAAASLQRPRRSARVLLAPRPQAPHTAHAIQRPAARPAAKRVRTALCATAGAAPGHHGGGGRPAPRPDAPRPREPAPVGAAASGGTPPRAAAGIRPPHCVSHPAPLGTPHRRGRSEPLDALTIAQRQARDAPHRRTPTERTGPRACAHNAS